jgi:outer membrane protein TolC
MKNFFLLLGVCTSFFIHAQEEKLTQKNTYTMTELVERALERRIILKALDQRIASNELSMTKAHVDALPRIGFSETIVGGLPLNGFPSLLSINGGISLSGINGARINYLLATQDKEISLYEKEHQKKLIRYNVEMSFLTNWMLQNQMKLIVEQKEAAHQMYDQEQQKYTLKLSKKSDWLTAAAEFENKLGALKNYPELLHEGLATLEFLTNCPLREEAQGMPKLIWEHTESHPKPLEEYYALAYKNRPEIKQKQAEEQKARYNKNYAQSSALPDININANYFIENGVNGYGTNDFYLKPTVKLSWSINDSIQSYFEAEKADAQAVKASLENQELRLQIKKEVEVAYRQWKTALNNAQTRMAQKLKAKELYDETVELVNLGLELESKKLYKKSELTAEEFITLSYCAEAGRKERALLYACGYPA